MTFEDLKKLRIQKQKPALPVILSLINLEDVENEVIYLNPQELKQDFRPLIGLEVFIAHVGEGVSFLLSLVDRVKTSGAKNIYLWNLKTGQRVLAVWEYQTDVMDYTHLAALDDMNFGGAL